MTRNARNRFVAWLGIAAMWLAIVAPVISQTIAERAAANDPQAVLCAVDASQADEGDAAHAGGHASSHAGNHAGNHDAASHFDACSYCGLLAHNLPVAVGFGHDAVRIERVTRVVASVHSRAVVSKSFNAASPRAPPVLS
ncbi:hypothetical protein A9R05_06955 [Burkholderia sp. KK1]|nr:hypothetical protein A9R05_06955 [Burkholderia sp. KK1]